MAEELILQVEKEKLNILQVVGAGTHQKAVDVELVVPDDNPDIDRILHVNVEVKPCARIRVIHDKVIIESALEIETVYAADNKEDDCPIHCMEHTVYFSDFIDVKNAEECMESDVRLEVEDVHFDELGGCKFRVVVVVQSYAKVFEPGEMEIISDMRILTRQEAENEGIEYERPIEGGPLPKKGMDKGKGPGAVHVVKSGDTLGAIARMHGVSIEAIARLNNLADINKLQIGQVLRLPPRR